MPTEYPAPTLLDRIIGASAVVVVTVEAELEPYRLQSGDTVWELQQWRTRIDDALAGTLKGSVLVRTFRETGRGRSAAVRLSLDGQFLLFLAREPGDDVAFSPVFSGVYEVTGGRVRMPAALTAELGRPTDTVRLDTLRKWIQAEVDRRAILVRELRKLVGPESLARPHPPLEEVADDSSRAVPAPVATGPVEPSRHATDAAPVDDTPTGNRRGARGRTH